MRSGSKSVAVVAVLIVSFCFAAVAEGAGLDPNKEFGSGGRVETNFGFDGGAPRADRINASAIQSDGKIVVAGTSRCAVGDCAELALARYETDGTLDLSFGDSGKRRILFGGTAVIEDIVVDESGRIVAVGKSNERVGDPDALLIMRFEEDGDFDRSFSEDGVRFTGLRNSDTWPLGALDLELLSDGDLAMAGWLACGSLCHHWLIGRFDEAGELDPEFLNGKLLRYTTPQNNVEMPESEQELGTSIDADAEGRLVISGPAGPDLIKVLRLQRDGDIDGNFGRNGVTILSAKRRTGSSATTRMERRPESMTVAPDGSIYVVAGHEGEKGNSGSVFRLESDGEWDREFGSGLGFAPTGRAAPNDVSVDRCGRIVTAGTWSVPFGNDFAVSRYLKDGRLDKAFGGTTRIRFGKRRDSSATSLELYGRKVYLAGSSEVRGRSDDFAVAAMRMSREAFRCAR